MIEGIKASVAPPSVAGSEATSKDPQDGRNLPPAAPSQPPQDQDPDAPVPAIQAKPATRLLIDQDKLTGVYVYRIVNAATGDLITEIPSDQVANLKNADDYVSGSVISTSA